MKCRDLTYGTVVCCGDSFTAEDCARLMKTRDIGFVPVTDESGSLVGTVTDRDLCLRIIADGRGLETPLRQVMTEGVVTCHPDDELEVAERKMAQYQIQRIVVAEDGHCVGVISLQDMMQQEESAERTHQVTEAIKSQHLPHARF